MYTKIRNSASFEALCLLSVKTLGMVSNRKAKNNLIFLGKIKPSVRCLW